MKKIAIFLLTAWVLTLTFSAPVHADNPQPPPDNSSPELKRIKSLAGRWTATTSMFGKPNEQVFTEYEVTSGGSAVLERVFPGTPMEMISVYYDDNGKLAMTHYCIMRNRPTLKLVSSTPDTIVLDVKKISGLKSKNDPSMGEVTIHFKDKDHIEQICKDKGKGKKDDKPHVLEFTRVQ